MYSIIIAREVVFILDAEAFKDKLLTGLDNLSDEDVKRIRQELDLQHDYAIDEDGVTHIVEKNLDTANRKHKFSDYNNIKVYDISGTDYIEFNILSDKQKINSSLLFPKNPRVRVKLSDITGINKAVAPKHMVSVKELANSYRTTGNFNEQGNTLTCKVFFKPDMQVEMHACRVAGSKKLPEKDLWFKVEPLYVSKTQQKFFYVGIGACSDLSSMLNHYVTIV